MIESYLGKSVNFQTYASTVAASKIGRKLPFKHESSFLYAQKWSKFRVAREEDLKNTYMTTFKVTHQYAAKCKI